MFANRNRMKILQIIPNLKKGGAERLVLDICHAFGDIDGVSVKLLLLSTENDYKELSKGIDVEYVSCRVELSLLRKNKFQINELQAILDSFQPDIIHSHLFKAEILSRSCYYPKAKWFSHIHDNMPQMRILSCSKMFSKQGITDYYEKHFLLKRYKTNGGNHFISISKHTNDYIKSVQNVHDSSVLLNGIAYRKFYKKKDLSKGLGDTIKLINIGSFVDKKNQFFLLGVVHRLLQMGHKIHLDLLGDGKNRARIEKGIKDLSISQNVTLHGLVDNVEEYLWEADFYVHSATYEPLGLVLLEGMAAGLPVVCLDGGGNRDIMENGKNGYMILDINPNTFAEELDGLIRDESAYAQISKYCQEFAKSYDIHNYVKSLHAIYKTQT